MMVTGVLFLSIVLIRNDNAQTIVINEVCNNNFSILNSEKNYDNYVELYNCGDNEQSLQGFKITDAEKKINYEIEDAVIEGHSYYLIPLQNKVIQNENGLFSEIFGLEEEGGTIILLDERNNIIDKINYPQNEVNISYARKNDGENQWSLQLPTPETANNDENIPCTVERHENINKPIFSKKSGFYNEAFELILTAEEGQTIYYTLDSSEPTKDSLVYSEPLFIEDASFNKNVYSSNIDITAQGQSEVGGIIVPTDLIDKATIVRAAACDKKGNYSEVATATFFVGFQNRTTYDNIGIISLISDPDNFFDYDIGIYAAGKTFAGPQITEDWLWQKANYRNKGKSAERVAIIEYFNEQHELVYTKKCGVRIRGKATRAYLQKSFNLFARKEYDGDNKFRYDFWGGGLYMSEISLVSGGNDILTKSLDYIASNMSEGLNFAYLDYLPCAVFLDGEYWGLYFISEKFNAEFISKHFNVPEDAIVMIRNWEVEEGEAEDLNQLHSDMEYIGSVNMRKSDEYKKVCSIVDIDSLIDYYAFQIYIGRHGDWLGRPEEGGNVGMWKTSIVSENTPYCDGKWRWLLFDVNSGAMADGSIDTMLRIEEKDAYNVFCNLMTNDEFSEKFYSRIEWMSSTLFSDEKIEDVLKEVSAEIESQVLLTHKRYYEGMFTEESYRTRMKKISDFFKGRHDYILELQK